MRIGTALAATAFAATALLAGASPALACDDKGNGGGYSHMGGEASYHSVGGPAGIVDAHMEGYKKDGAFSYDNDDDKDYDYDSH